MKKLAFVFGSLSFVMAAPLSAQATRTWVSGVGDDVNPCSRTAPCKTFAGAISKTATNGEINCLDSAGFGGVTITKSIIIDCHTEHGGILALNTNGVIVNGAGAVVTLRGLVINGAGGTTGNGIRILQAAAVNVDDVIVENFAGTGSNGRGITVETAADLRLTVQNSNLWNLTNHGLHVNPTAGNVNLVVDSTQISRGGAAGIQIRQNTTASINNVSITNHSVGAGLALELTNVGAHLSNSTIANNSTGIFLGSPGGAPTIRIYGSVITNNSFTGIAINNGSNAISYGNNAIRANGGNEAPSQTIPPT